MRFLPQRNEKFTEDMMNRLDINRLGENIDRAAAYDMDNHKLFGSAYYVYQDGVELEKCYGTQTLKGDAPITGNTVFRLASMTKPITAVATLILVERGLLSLDDPIDRFLPEFGRIKIKDAQGNLSEPQKLPTLRHLLTHTSGIATIPEKFKGITPDDKKTLDSAVAFYLKGGLDYEPGTKQLYSGTAAFNVLAKIIETVSGTDYLTFLKKEILAPCEMPDTTFIPSVEQKVRMVEMHQKENGENAVFAMPEGCVFESYPCTHYLGGAGLISTLHDYANFAKMLLHQGKTKAGQILTKESVALLGSPHVSKDIMPYHERWGLGVRVITEERYRYLPKGTFGWSGAYGSHFWVDPVNRIVAVYMKNSKFDGGAGNESARNFEKAVFSSFMEE